MPKKKGGVVDSRFDVGALKQKERDITAQFEDAEDAEECERDGGSEDEVVIDEDASESEEDGSDDDRSLSEQGLSEEEKDDSDGSLENEDYDTDKVQGEGTDPDHDDDDHEDDEDGHQDEEEGAGGKQERVRGKKKKVRGVLSRDELQTFKDRAEQTGVIYISRIPPFMKPIKLRHYFSAYGTVGRIYLQAEDPMARKKRQRMGGNKKKKFTEGWVEFLDKGNAKVVAKTLNNQPVGGRKRSYYAYDLWNIKYLPKFKWHHLTERIAYENAVREKRLQLAMRQATRENNYYLENVDKSRMIKDMEARKKAKRPAEAETAPVMRTFKQRPMLDHAQAKKKHKPDP